MQIIQNCKFRMLSYVISLILISFLSICNAQNQTTSQTIPDVCEVWKSSDNANYSYFLEISVKQGYYFCSGILVEPDWVLMSYSCFLRIANFAADPLTYKQSSSTPKLQSFYKSTNCFELENLEDTQIYVKSVAGNCVNGTGGDIQFGLYTVPLFGVVYNEYQVKNIQFNDNFFDNNNSNSNTQNAQNLNVHVNDLVLLKLRDKFLDVPLELVKRSPFDFENQDIDYEIYLQVQLEGNQFLIFGQTNVTSENQENNFECSKNLQNAVCEQNQQICTNQTYVCGKFEMPDLGPMYAYQLQSGDPLVRKQDSMNAEIFGFFSADFIPQDYRKYYESISKQFYSYKFGNYSFDSNGAVFNSFTEKSLNWINNIPNLYDEDRCKDVEPEARLTQEKSFPLEESKDEGWKIIVIACCVVVVGGIVVVAILMYAPWKKRSEYKSVNEADKIISMMEYGTSGHRSRLDQIDMMGLGEVSSIYDKDKDSAFNCPNWWSGIQLPQGVRDIPLSDLIGIQQLGSGGFAVVYQAEFEEKAREKYGELGKQQVAVKIVYKEYFQIKDSMQAILKEVAAMSKLDSEHIVKMIGASLVIRPSIVLELVPYGSLENLLSKEGYKCHQTSLAWKLKLLLNISKGIQYLHSENVIHRDLKPANILIQDPENARTKITDFGLAKIKQQATGEFSKNCAGTPQYMSPEMYDKCENIDEKVDIWALGIIMQYILRGIKPWDGQDENYIICRVSVYKEGPDDGELPDDCPEELSTLIRSCWNEKSERPSADYIVDKLETILQKIDVSKQNLNSQNNSKNKFTQFSNYLKQMRKS